MRIFQQNKDKWLGKWLDALFSTYPAESAFFFRNTIDSFSNPVGATLKTGLTDLYDALTAPRFNPEATRKILEPVVKLRAVQEFTPALALGFIYELKAIVSAGSQLSGQEKEVVFSRIDTAMLYAFDLYMENKKIIYTLRASQARDNVRQLLIKKDLICELPEIDPELAR